MNHMFNLRLSLLSFTLVVLWAPVVYAQESAWTIQVGTDAGDEVAKCICAAPAGGFVLAGASESAHNDDNEILVAKFDDTGQELWSHTYGEGGNDEALDICPAGDGGFYIVGTTSATTDSLTNAFVLKIDTQGNQQWLNQVGNQGQDSAVNVAPTPGGGCIVTHQLDQLTTSVVVLQVLDSNGQEMVRVDAPGTGHACGAVANGQGGYTLCWWELVANPECDMGLAGSMHLLNLDANGNELWHQSLPDEEIYIPNDIKATPDGGWILTGVYDLFGGNSKIFIMKLNPQGERVWQINSGGDSWDVAHGLLVTTEGDYIATGQVQSAQGDNEYFLLKLSPNADILWENYYGTIGNEIAFDLAQAADGGFMIVGQTELINGETNKPHSNICILKTDAQGYHPDQLDSLQNSVGLWTMYR